MRLASYLVYPFIVSGLLHCGSASLQSDATPKPDGMTPDGPPKGAVDFTITPDNYGFGAVIIGSTSLEQTFTVTNTGEGTVTLTRELTGATGHFALAGDCDNQMVNPTDTCEMTVRFAPVQTPGNREVTLTVTDGTLSKQAVITGNAVTGGNIVLNGSATRDLGGVDVGSSVTEVFWFQNVGGQDAAAQVALTRMPLTEVSKGDDTCDGQTLSPNQMCKVEVVIAPTVPGQKSGMLELTSGSGSATAAVTAQGQTTVNVTVNGSGATTEPQMGSCTNQCSHVYTSGSQVIIAGVPDDNTYYIDNISGCASIQNNACTVSLDAATKNITIDFSKKPKLTVNENDPSSVGTVSAAGLGPSCGTNCTYQDPDDNLTLTASNTTYFDGWVSCPDVNGNQCKIEPMGNSNRTITANYKARRTLLLTITSGNAPQDNVQIDSGTPCATNCSNNFPDGQQVELDASGPVRLWVINPASAAVSGFCGNDSTSCRVNMTSNVTVEAIFDFI